MTPYINYRIIFLVFLGFMGTYKLAASVTDLPVDGNSARHLALTLPRTSPSLSGGHKPRHCRAARRLVVSGAGLSVDGSPARSLASPSSSIGSKRDRCDDDSQKKGKRRRRGDASGEVLANTGTPRGRMAVAGGTAELFAAPPEERVDDGREERKRSRSRGRGPAAAAAAATVSPAVPPPEVGVDAGRGSERRGRGGGSAVAAAAEEGDDGEEGEEDGDIVFGEQIYANPIFDSAAKYLLADSHIRLGFMKVFTGNPDIVSTKLLDSSLNPLRSLTQARDFLSDKGNIAFMEMIAKGKRKNIRVKLVDSRGKGKVVKRGGNFLRGLSKVFGDIKKAFPPLERNSQLDVVCKLSNGEFVLVEVQVKPQDFWNRRALAYAAAFYGNQLKRGGEWSTLKRVISINLLGGESSHWRDCPLEVVRHYKFVSAVDGDDEHFHEIDDLQLIQYNLLSPEIDDLAEGELKEWLQFWKSAHEKRPEDIIHIRTPAVRKAYKRVKVETLPDRVKGEYKKESGEYREYSGHIRAVETEARAKGKEEGELKAKLETASALLKMRLPDRKIIRATHLTADQLEDLKKEQG